MPWHARREPEEKHEVEHVVDARGLPCPQPVILTRKALEAHDVVTTTVDNDTAQENVTRNSGVKLVVQGSPVLEDLQALAAQGVEILACGTCLGYFGLTDQVAVGQVSNMYTIAETLLRAGKVVSL